MTAKPVKPVVTNDYQYDATILRVVDGDTVHAEVDLGFDHRVRMKFRLYGIDAPELTTPEGKESRDNLKELLPVGSKVVITTIKDKQEKYGRYLAIIDFKDTDVNAWLVGAGLAVERFY